MLRPKDISQQAAPSALLTLAQAKSWLRIVHDSEDDLISMQISAVSAYLDGPEGVLGRFIGGGSYSFEYEPALSSGGVTLGLKGRVSDPAAVEVNGAIGGALLSYRHGIACLVPVNSNWSGLQSLTVSADFDPIDDPRVTALASTLMAQLFEYREEVITERVSKNPAVERLIAALRTRLIA